MTAIEKLKKNMDEYKRVADLYNRLVGVEEDHSKFVPKETDLETVRTSLLKNGVILQSSIKQNLKTIEEATDGSNH